MLVGGSRIQSQHVDVDDQDVHNGYSIYFVPSDVDGVDAG